MSTTKTNIPDGWKEVGIHSIRTRIGLYAKLSKARLTGTDTHDETNL